MMLPSKEKLHALPRWALCAFAIRCARRFLPLYRVYVRRAPEHLVAIERALELSERRVTRGDYSELYDPYDLQALEDTLGAICEASLNTEADASGMTGNDVFSREARAYVTVAITASTAFEVTFYDELSSDKTGFDASKTVADALSRISKSGSAPENEISEAIWLDFEIIRQLTQSEELSDVDGIDQKVFGPMWPGARPQGWPGDYVSSFRPRARLMLLLGDQLIKDAGIAVFELVKNAYDADATKCVVTLHDIDQNANTAEVTVQDDGCGMNLQTLLKVWLEPGTDHRAKQRDRQERTPRYGRQVLGEKGVGRFAVHKLGQIVTLVTRAKGEDELYLTLDWTVFENANYLGDVPIQLNAREPQIFKGDQTGTHIHIASLHEAPWTRGRVRSLHRAISSIRSPFSGPESFAPELKVVGKRKLDWLRGMLRVEDVVEQAPFRVIGTIEGSIFRYKYEFVPRLGLDRVDSRKSENEMVIMAPDEDGHYSPVTVDPLTVGAVCLDFYIFDRTPQILKLTSSDPKGLKDFLDFNGGVRVYRNDIRVYDFGEPGNDWLNLGGRRVNLPTGRISNNQVLGTVRISSPFQTGTGLIEKTNREGFVENDAYRAFHKAVLFAMEQAEMERNIDKKRIRLAYAKGKHKELVISELSELRSELKSRNLENELGGIVDRIEIQYRQVTERLLISAGAGLNLSVVLHEVEKTIYDLKSALEHEEERSVLLQKAKRLSDMVDGLTWLTRKSGLSDVSMGELIGHAIANWKFRYSHHSITVTNGLLKGDPDFKVKGYRRLLLTTLMNLIDNAIHWLGTQADDRRIYIGTTLNAHGKPALIVADNGPGFLDEPEFLTEPFFSRRPEGMGLGLHIADEVMKQHEGRLLFPEIGELDLDPAFNGAIVVLQFNSKI